MWSMDVELVWIAPPQIGQRKTLFNAADIYVAFFKFEWNRGWVVLSSTVLILGYSLRMYCKISASLLLLSNF